MKRRLRDIAAAARSRNTNHAMRAGDAAFRFRPARPNDRQRPAKAGLSRYDNQNEPTMPVQTPAGIAIADHLSASDALGALASELATRGWLSRPHVPAGRRPSLDVQNPEPGASVLCERIYASPGQDGTWWFWWPWADKTAPTAEPSAAAATIMRVLRAATDAASAR
jgi:hypothetical protein